MRVRRTNDLKQQVSKGHWVNPASQLPAGRRQTAQHND